MANKKISQLTVRSPLSLTDLMLVGDPSTGYSYKTTINDFKTFALGSILLNDLGDVTTSSPTNGQVLQYNGTAWVNATLTSALTGSGASGYIAYWTGTSSLSGESGFFYDAVNDRMGLGTDTPEATLEIHSSGTNNVRGFLLQHTDNTTALSQAKIIGARSRGSVGSPSAVLSNDSLVSFNARGYKATGWSDTLGGLYVYAAENFTDTATGTYIALRGVATGGTTVSEWARISQSGLTLTTISAESTDTDRFLVSNAGLIKYRTGTQLLSDIGAVPTTRQLTINGTTFDLSADRTWTISFSGLTSLNTLTASSQTFAVGTSGTDFNISSATSTHTFNLPTASATVRGALSSSDWVSFNAKIGTGTTLTSGFVPYATGSNQIENGFVYITNSAPDFGVLTTLSGDDFGFYVFKNATNRYVLIGDYASNVNSSHISINDLSSVIETRTQIGSMGLKIDFTNTNYILGDFDGNINGTTIHVADSINRITLTGFTYLLGIDNSTWANVLYYDVATGEVTYGAAPSGGGITSLNTLTASSQTFATGTSGTDFNISSATSTHTFNLPSASATNRGALTSADWTTFNNKQSAITLTTTGSSGASTFVSNTLNVPNYTLSGLGGVPTTRNITINGVTQDLSVDRTWTISTGGVSGTVGYISYFNSTTTISNSFLFQDNAGAILKTIFTTGEMGMKLDSGNDNYLIGDFNNISNGCYINVNSNSRLFRTFFQNALFGIEIDQTQSLVTFGDITGALNSTKIIVDDGLNLITLNGQLKFQGLASGTTSNVLYIDGTGVISYGAAPSGSAYSVTTVTTTYTETATSGTKIIKADTTGGAFSITLPTAISNTATIVIKKISGTATLTIDGNGTQTIDDGLTASIVEIYESITLISDGSNWQII